MCIIFMDLLLLPRPSEASFQTERKTVVLPPLPATAAAQGAPNSTTTAQKSPRSESDDLDLPAMDNPARNRDPLFAKLRKVEEDDEELSQDINTGIQESWREVSCNPRVLCDSLQKHPLR